MSRTWLWSGAALAVGVGLWWHFRKSKQPKVAELPSSSDEAVVPVAYLPADVTFVEQIEPVIASAGKGWNMGSLIHHGVDAEYRVFQLPDATLAHKPQAAQWVEAISRSLKVDPKIVKVVG